jgi:hypothetical protein
MTGGLEASEYDEPIAASSSDGGVIFVLENAQLEAAKVGKNYELLNCDDHANFLRRHNKDPALFRPDICHQARAVFASASSAVPLPHSSLLTDVCTSLLCRRYWPS